MAQSPMISAPLKATSEIDWVTPLKAYIRNTYGDDPERYAEECATLNRLRQDLMGVGKDTTSGRDMLYRYYAQLELLDLRFPVDENHIKISFTWFDAFTNKATSQYSLAFEKASIIFNIAAVLSGHGSLQTRSDDSSLKLAYHSFQASAGMYTYINENFLHAPSSDLSRSTVKTLIHVMLAQAQEIFLEKQIRDQQKPGLLAKLASQAAHLYAQALEGAVENVGRGIFEKVWQLLIQIKSNHVAAVSQYYQALADDDANNYGIAIARLQVAEGLAKEANKNASGFPYTVSPSSNLGAETGSIMADITKRNLAAVQEKLKALNRDNDYLYHVPVPAEATLSPVPKAPAAKPIPVSELYAGQEIQRITGPDLFSKIVPLSVTEAASMYDEEKAKLVRAESERVDLANGELAASLDYLRLPAVLQVLKGNFDLYTAPGDEFRTWCEDVHGHENPTAIFDVLKAERETVVGVLDRCSKHLDMEESVCEKMRSKFDRDWTQQPSARLTTTLRSDIRGYRDGLDEALRTDGQLAANLRQNGADFDEMRHAVEHGEVDALFQRAVAKMRARSGPGAGAASEPSLLDVDFDDAGPTVMEQVSRVEEILKKLDLIKKERNQILWDFKDKVHNDDISHILLLNKKAIANFESQLFQQELEKFRPYQNRLMQANHKQSSLMKELTKACNTLLKDKRVLEERQKCEALTRTYSSVSNRYKRVYQDFLDLQAGLGSAATWYAEMRETVQSLEKNVDTFVNNRRSEGAQLLSQIEQERQANKASQAEMERERLRELMERMSVARAEPPPPPTKPKHKPEPIFAPGAAAAAAAAAAYPPYQASRNPAPSQQQGSYIRPSYDPSHFGRNPGPTSPPPNQSSFGMSSPPPTQTTFMSTPGVAPSPAPQNHVNPTSPPPTQMSFPKNHHQSYPGYPSQAQGPPHRPISVPGHGATPPPQPPQQQQQHQQKYPPNSSQQAQQGVSGYSGFVIPPPPAGPPPLGPQQTIHYDSRDYQYDNRLSTENMARMEGRLPPPPPPPPSANQDPWAGLNAWR